MVSSIRPKMFKLLIILLPAVLSGCLQHGYPWAKSEGQCELTLESKRIAYANVTNKMRSERSRHSEYCNLEKDPAEVTFWKSGDKCRVYLGCYESDGDGGMLLHGDVFVYIDPDTLVALEITKVAW